MRKRKPPIAKSLINNSIVGMMSAIEIHNKPVLKYRYETVVLLVLNSWELLLKGYIHKFHKKTRLINKDGTTKPFENCLNVVNQKIGKNFNPVQENLSVLYGYRNKVAHFYISELAPIIYALIRKSITFYSKFLKQHFKIDLTEESDLILLPIGFKKPLSPIDYLSNEPFSNDASKEVKIFLKSILNATKRLNDNDISETILVDFKMNLTNVNKIKNADLIAGIDNSNENLNSLKINKNTRLIRAGKIGEEIVLTRDKSKSQTNLVYEELQEGIFDEINNIVEANRLLAKDKKQFMLGAKMYYRIYAERQYVNFSVETFELMARTAMLEMYAPFIFWLTKLPAKTIAKIILDVYVQLKVPKLHNLLKIMILLGQDGTNLFSKILKSRYTQLNQNPDFYYTFFKLVRSTKENRILKALDVTSNKKFSLYGNEKKFDYNDFISNNSLANNNLSLECINVFNEKYSQRKIARELDYLTYGSFFVNNQNILEAFYECCLEYNIIDEKLITYKSTGQQTRSA